MVGITAWGVGVLGNGGVRATLRGSKKGFVCFLVFSGHGSGALESRRRQHSPNVFARLNWWLASVGTGSAGRTFAALAFSDISAARRVRGVSGSGDLGDMSRRSHPNVIVLKTQCRVLDKAGETCLAS